MRRKIIICGFIVLTLTLGALIYSRFGEKRFGLLAPTATTQSANINFQPTQLTSEKIIFAAPGRVEATGETVEIGSSADGVLVAVPVREGQKVHAGQVLAIVSCDELKSEIEAGRASVERARQERARLIRGSRPEERQRAQTQIIAAQSTLNHAKLHYERMTLLADEGVVARAEWDTAKRDYELAQTMLRTSEQTAKLINAPPLPEETGKVDAEIREAEQRVLTAAARLEKCTVKSPLDGTILRVHQFPGAAVSTINARPIISIADLSELRIRAEVDERDIGKISVGQKVNIIIDAYSERRFQGTVASIGDLMGRKKVRTGNPAEKSDSDVLDVLINFDKTDSRFVVGLRSTIQFSDAAPSYSQNARRKP